jgi:hypothetical protein
LVGRSVRFTDPPGISWVWPWRDPTMAPWKSHINSVVAPQLRPSSSLTRGFLMPEYIIAYLVFHTSSLRKDSSKQAQYNSGPTSRTLCIRVSCVRRRESIIRDQRMSYDHGKMLIYSKAMANGILSLLRLINTSSNQS